MGNSQSQSIVPSDTGVSTTPVAEESGSRSVVAEESNVIRNVRNVNVNVIKGANANTNANTNTYVKAINTNTIPTITPIDTLDTVRNATNANMDTIMDIDQLGGGGKKARINKNNIKNNKNKKGNALENRTVERLRQRAKELGINGRSKLSKQELIDAIREKNK